MMVIDHLQGEACINAHVEGRLQVLFALLLICDNGFENAMRQLELYVKCVLIHSRILQ